MRLSTWPRSRTRLPAHPIRNAFLLPNCASCTSFLSKPPFRSVMSRAQTKSWPTCGGTTSLTSTHWQITSWSLFPPGVEPAKRWTTGKPVPGSIPRRDLKNLNRRNKTQSTPGEKLPSRAHRSQTFTLARQGRSQILQGRLQTADWRPRWAGSHRIAGGRARLLRAAPGVRYSPMACTLKGCDTNRGNISFVENTENGQKGGLTLRRSLDTLYT